MTYTVIESNYTLLDGGFLFISYVVTTDDGSTYVSSYRASPSQLPENFTTDDINTLILSLYIQGA